MMGAIPGLNRTMSMPVTRRMRAMGVKVQVASVLFRGVDMQTAPGPEGPDPESDQHETHGQLADAVVSWGPPNAGQQEDAAQQEHRDRVTDPPTGSKFSRASEYGAGADEGGDRDHVIDFQRVKEAESKGGHQGDENRIHGH
jgi:hypothetical protein